MECCRRPLQGTDRFFSKQSRRYLKKFRTAGLAKEQRLLFEGIVLSEIRDMAILEIGCGVGALHLSLLKRGARSAVGVDIAEGMLEGARTLSREYGLETRTRYLLGDFVGLEQTVAPADITLLDKVVCCYEDVGALLGASLAKTGNIYALSFPRSNPISRLFIAFASAMGKLLKWSFHPYWHDWPALTERIRAAGFLQTYRRTTLFWDVRVFARQDA
jgi:SAM-dependent methyltransferase